MATIKSFEEIKSWQKARDVCNQIGLLIDEGRFKNNYRLIAQIEGSSGSIMDNIAEGFERGSKAEFENIKKELLNISGLLQNMIGYLQKSNVDGVRKKVEKNFKT